MCAHAFGGIPLSHHEGRDAYIQWQDKYCYALHSAAVTVTSSSGVRPKGLPEYDHWIRKKGPTVCELADEPILARMGCV